MYSQRRRRLIQFLDDHELDALVLRRPSSVAWAAGGARTHIDVSGDTGVAWLVVTRDGTRIVTSRIEAGRMAAEELTGPGYEWTILDWVTDLGTAVPTGDRVGVDGPMPGRRDVSAELEVARRPLLPEEIELYRALGRDAHDPDGIRESVDGTRAVGRPACRGGVVGGPRQRAVVAVGGGACGADPSGSRER